LNYEHYHLTSFAQLSLAQKHCTFQFAKCSNKSW